MARHQFTASDLIYDPKTHTSQLPDGTKIPHVTEVLSAVRVTMDFEELGSRSQRLAQQIEIARHRGTSVHADCHAYDDDDIVIETVDPLVMPYLEVWMQFRKDKKIEPLAHARERRLYHPLYRYTGIQDGVFNYYGGRKTLRVQCDIKTGDPEDAAAHLQTAAYEAAWNHEHPKQKIDERWAVWLRPGRKKQAEVINYSAREDAFMDFQKFLACLATYREQPERRTRVA